MQLVPHFHYYSNVHGRIIIFLTDFGRICTDAVQCVFMSCDWEIGQYSWEPNQAPSVHLLSTLMWS